MPAVLGEQHDDRERQHRGKGEDGFGALAHGGDPSAARASRGCYNFGTVGLKNGTGKKDEAANQGRAKATQIMTL
jgi:hypothetical protein